jgi:hypothetical protein
MTRICAVSGMHERMADLAEDSHHVFECLSTVRMVQGRDLQGGQDGRVLTDPGVVNLSSQPPTYGFTAGPAGGNLTARSGKSGYGLRA